MTDPMDLFESIRQDSVLRGDPARAGSPNDVEACDIQAIVSNALSVQKVPTAIRGELAVAELSLDKASLLQDETMSLVTSEPFLREASNEIGQPRPGESEDDFVARAKEALRALLKRLLGN